MKIYIDKKEIAIYNGARVKDVLLKLSPQIYREVFSGEKDITDKLKNPIDLDGELIPHQRLYLMNTDLEINNEKQ